MPDQTGSELPVGTYVDRETSEHDHYITVLYLRPGGRFLLRGILPGYESSVAAGRWECDGAEVKLEGDADVRGCCPDQSFANFGRRFRQSLHVIRRGGALSLLADAEANGWSMLGRRGPYRYIGDVPFIFESRMVSLPGSLAEVDKEIKLQLADHSNWETPWAPAGGRRRPSKPGRGDPGAPSARTGVPNA